MQSKSSASKPHFLSNHMQVSECSKPQFLLYEQVFIQICFYILHMQFMCVYIILLHHIDIHIGI